MKIIRGIYNLKQQFSCCVLTMGNFDGLHLGHQSLISRLQQVGKDLHLPTVAMIFEPQPAEYFSLERAPARLTSFHEKYYYLSQFNIDYLLCIPFNQSVAHLSSEQFIKQWLINKLQAQYIIIGDDFHFGAKRQGNAKSLAEFAEQGDFELESLSTFSLDSVRVSSTAIRDALSSGNFDLAEQLLGRPYSIRGKVVHGNALARQLGFPTANIHLARHKVALHGVYFVSVKNLCNNQQYHGIANIGLRPTVNGKKATLEVNIFDFKQDIYGHHLEIFFKEKIRDEQRFASLDDLKQQIAQDVCIAKQISAQF